MSELTKSNIWMPKVGEKCLFKAMAKTPGLSHFSNEFNECIPDMITKFGAVVTVGSIQAFLDSVDYIIEFKPLKEDKAIIPRDLTDEHIMRIWTKYSGTNFSGLADKLNAFVRWEDV